MQETLQRYKELKDIIAILGMDELSEEDRAHRATVRAASSASSPSPWRLQRCLPANPGKYVPVEETIEGFKAIVNGEVDDLPEAAFFMVGDIEEAKAKAAAMQKE